VSYSSSLCISLQYPFYRVLLQKLKTSVPNFENVSTFPIITVHLRVSKGFAKNISRWQDSDSAYCCENLSETAVVLYKICDSETSLLKPKIPRFELIFARLLFKNFRDHSPPLHLYLYQYSVPVWV